MGIYLEWVWSPHFWRVGTVPIFDVRKHFLFAFSGNQKVQISGEHHPDIPYIHDKTFYTTSVLIRHRSI